MIRDFKNEDFPILIKIIKQGIEIGEQDIVKHLKSDDMKIIVYDDADEGILGFAYFKIWDKDNKKGDLQLYVIPNARLKGIGNLLFHEIMKFESEIKLNCIYSRFRVDIGEAKQSQPEIATSGILAMTDRGYFQINQS